MLKNMKLSKQKNILWLGAFTDSLFATLPLLSVINFLSIQTVLYANVKEYILPWAPWLTFVWFIALMVLITLGAMVLVYKFVIPSLWVWRGSQLYGHQSILMDEIKGLRAKMDEREKAREMEAQRFTTAVQSLSEEVQFLREELAKSAAA